MANNNFDNNSDKEESKFKNTQNADKNYRYFNENIHLVKKGISVKVHNGRYDSIHNPTTDKTEMIWTVMEPIYVTFSWKDKNNNTFSFPLSFHIDVNEFIKKINGFLNIEPEQSHSYGSYYS